MRSPMTLNRCDSECDHNGRKERQHLSRPDISSFSVVFRLGFWLAAKCSERDVAELMSKPHPGSRTESSCSHGKDSVRVLPRPHRNTPVLPIFPYHSFLPLYLCLSLASRHTLFFSPSHDRLSFALPHLHSDGERTKRPLSSLVPSQRLSFPLPNVLSRTSSPPLPLPVAGDIATASLCSSPSTTSPSPFQGWGAPLLPFFFVVVFSHTFIGGKEKPQPTISPFCLSHLLLLRGFFFPHCWFRVKCVCVSSLFCRSSPPEVMIRNQQEMLATLRQIARLVSAPYSTYLVLLPVAKQRSRAPLRRCVYFFPCGGCSVLLSARLGHLLLLSSFFRVLFLA